MPSKKNGTSKMRKIIDFFKKEMMLSVALVAAVASLFITPPSTDLFSVIDWKTLATLFMLLSVLEGFKQENIFEPLLRRTTRILKLKTLTCFFVYGVFFSSMFVTNDVSLIIFVPLTITVFKSTGKEKFILPVLAFENIAAIRGSLLTPFGSPQNLFLFSQSGISAGNFLKMMFPLWFFSFFLLYAFIALLYRKNSGEAVEQEAEVKQVTEGLEGTEAFSRLKEDEKKAEGLDFRLQEKDFGLKKSNDKEGKKDKKFWTPKKILYAVLFFIIILTIVTRTVLWPAVTLIVALALLFFDRKILLKTDYVLLLTFLCFFVFSSSICKNPTVAAFLQKIVGGHEYLTSILLSQVISNVPAAIVLWPFSGEAGLRPLLYGLDSAGLCSIIGSLASVINLRIYVREYPGKALAFMKTFTWISLLFFLLVVFPQLALIKLF